MTTYVYPKGNVIVTAAVHAQMIQAELDQADRVVEGYEISAGTGLEAIVGTGTAIIEGYVVIDDASRSVSLTDEATNYIFLDKDGNLTVNTDGAPPASSIQLGRVVCSGGAITTIYDDRPLARKWTPIKASQDVLVVRDVSDTEDRFKITEDGYVHGQRFYIGSHYLSTLLANDKVSDSDMLDGKHATDFRVRLYRAGADEYYYPPNLRADYDNKKLSVYDGASWLDIIGGGVGSVEQASKLVASGYTLDTLDGNNKVPSASSADSASSASQLSASGYVLDTLVANNKVPDSDKLDGYHATSFRFRHYTGGADVYRYPGNLRADEDNHRIQVYNGSAWVDIIGNGYGNVAQASKLAASGYVLDTLIANNKVPDSSKWDGKSRTDDQTIGGNITIGGDLRVNGNDILDGEGKTRITLGSTVSINENLAVGGTANLCQIVTSMHSDSRTSASWGAHTYGLWNCPLDLGKFGSSQFRFRETTPVANQSHGVRLYNVSQDIPLAVHETNTEGAGTRNVSVPCTPPSGVKVYRLEFHSDGSNYMDLYSSCLQSSSPLKNLFLVEIEKIEEDFVDVDGKVKKRRVKVPRGWSKLRFSYGVHAYDLEKGLMVIQIPDFVDVETVKTKIRALGYRMDETTQEELRKYQEEWGYRKASEK